MAWDKGMGTCLIPDSTGKYCEKQIQEGEAIGTVIMRGGPVVGHKRCADAFHARKAQAEREARQNMVKRYDQASPGGPIDYNSERDGIMGSIPLEKPEPVQVQAQLGGSAAAVTGAAEAHGDLAALARAAGVHNIADVPEDATPDDAVALAEAQNAEEYAQFLAELRTSKPADAQQAPEGGPVELPPIEIDLSKVPPDRFGGVIHLSIKLPDGR